MTFFNVRRIAAILSQETNKPISDVLVDIVAAVQSGVVQWENKFCPFCGDRKDIPVTSSIGGSPVYVRLHKCGFCGTNFRSHETKLVGITEELLPKVAGKKKKPHIKNRGR